jgi:aryl-alcohol dehydrogenase-like predicted oxidoreductase
VRFFDTAPAYGEAQALLARALAGREGATVATKLAIPRGGWQALSPEQTRAHVRRSALASLRTLRRERLEVLQIHNADTALLRRGAVSEALAELCVEGVVANAGATVYGEENALAALADPRLALVQIAYSALDRRPERRVLSAAEVAGKAIVARSLLLHGVLSPAGAQLRGAFTPLAAAAEAVRRALEVSWQELPGAAVAFVLSRPGVRWALVGPRDEHELETLLDGVARHTRVTALLPVLTRELDPRLLDPSTWPVEVDGGR